MGDAIYICICILLDPLDHFIFDDSMVNKVNSFKVLCDGNNLSDHRPIFLSLCLNVDMCNNVMNEHENVADNITDWQGVSADQISDYKFYLDELFEQINIPEDVINCNNLLCNEHDQEIFDYLDIIIYIMSSAGELSIPRKKSSFVKSKMTDRGRMAGWNQYVKKDKEDCICWFTTCWSSN